MAARLGWPIENAWALIIRLREGLDGKEGDKAYRRDYISSTLALAYRDAEPEYNAAVTRLAQLKPHEYDRVRKAEANRLFVRTGTLDAAIGAARKEAQANELGRQGQGARPARAGAMARAG